MHMGANMESREGPGVPQVNEKLLFDSNRHSGLEMLDARETAEVAKSADEDLRDLMALIRATPFTWRQWRGKKRLRIYEALALYHHLDPDAMGLRGRRSGERHGALCEKYMGIRDSPLRTFRDQLVWVCAYAKIGRLRVETLCEEDAADSTVRRADFSRFMSGQPVMADLWPPNGASGADADWRPYRSRSSNPLVAGVIGADALYLTVADGGSYVPGDPKSAPDVDGYLRQDHPGVSATKRRQLCEIVRPLELPKGRAKA